MNVSNHLLSGAAIALAVKQPAIALPLAFAAHYVLDALPHYGFERQGFSVWLKKKSAGLLLTLDSIAVVLVIGTLIMNREFFALLAAFVSVSPDTVWIYRYFLYERKNKASSYNWFNRFHLSVQWCERRWGIYVELVFFVVLFTYVQMFQL